MTILSSFYKTVQYYYRCPFGNRHAETIRKVGNPHDLVDVHRLLTRRHQLDLDVVAELDGLHLRPLALDLRRQVGGDEVRGKEAIAARVRAAPPVLVTEPRRTEARALIKPTNQLNYTS